MLLASINCKQGGAVILCRYTACKVSFMFTPNGENPCLSCGACCASYRASFYWSEADPACGGVVPPELTEQLDPSRAAMKGTNQPHPRCIALEGQIGIAVRCRIYQRRPSVCREFSVAWEDDLPNERCDKARALWGLPPLPRPTERFTSTDEQVQPLVPQFSHV